MIDESAGNRNSDARGVRASVAALAILLALIALLLGGWSAWRLTRLQRDDSARIQQSARIATRVDAAERSLAAADKQQQASDQQLADADADARALRDNLQEIDQRTRNLETALGTLTDQQLNSRDALLLDDAEFLLRAGCQRFTLFHDANGALQAYTLADQALAHVQDPAFAPVRASVANERAALAAAAPPAREHALDMLNVLRAQLPSLPLAEPEIGAAKQVDKGAWSHLWHALSGVLRIEHDGDAPLPAADARFARELAALDLAQAQAGLLAFDDPAFHAALARVDATLTAHFDPGATSVRAARADIRQLLATRPVISAPQLGGALAQLRDLRATHALQTIAPLAAPTSSGVP